MEHELKIAPKYFEHVLSGDKTFELRKNDRNFKIGDTLVLNEWDKEYTGRKIEKEITYILDECPNFGLEKGYVILSMRGR